MWHVDPDVVTVSNIPIRHIQQTMNTDMGVPQLGGLLISFGMILTGYLGLTGTLSPSPLLVAVIFIAAVLLAYFMGKNRGKQEQRRVEARRT